MHLYMSSYNDAPYLSSVWYPSLHSSLLSSSDMPGIYHLALSHHFRSENSYPGQTSGLPCNTPLNIMAKEYPVSGLSDIQKNSIADLVKSDDLFLDQLEVMHYLNFSTD